jgi:hypothetical protein
MTNKQTNAAIAESVKWPGNLICKDFNGNLWPSAPPNYCTDLNAMHEAESILHGRAAEIYAECLLRRTGAQGTGDKRFFGATARQRAEALLMVLGKWEEGE